MCLKPAPQSSMGCKFYGRFFFSSRKIWSVVCRLVDHSIGLFIIFRKISRPVYERENVTPVQNFRIKGHFCHRLKKKDTSVTLKFCSVQNHNLNMKRTVLSVAKISNDSSVTTYGSFYNTEYY